MSRIEILVRHDAELDAFGYFQYINKRNPEASVRFLVAIDDTIAGLAQHPLKGRLRDFRSKNLRNIRSWRVDDFENYLIFYRFENSRLEILRIRHGRMRFPGALLNPFSEP